MLKNLVKSVGAARLSKTEVLLIGLILGLALFIRVYRINDLLGFYYDQGRDALVIWDLIHKGKFFLIGPTTGIEGIFRGPLYYYLIAPFYWLGQGNPVWPSVFLSLTSVLAILPGYILARRNFGKVAGFMFIILAGFSYQIFYASRWLSNPTPMLLLSMVFIWSLLRLWQGKARFWPVAVMSAGLSLFHFGSAGEIFYFLVMLVIFFWKRVIPNKRIIVLTFIIFITVVAPQLIFDLRHDRILSNNFQKAFFAGGSFALPIKQFIKDKIFFYHDVFTYKIFPQRSPTQAFFLTAFLVLFIYYFRELAKFDLIKVLVLTITAPMLGLMYFKGNYGNIYDYYLTGYYLPFLLLVSVFLGWLWRRQKFFRPFLVWFVVLFLISNLRVIKSTLADDGSDSRSVIFANQKRAIDWVYQDAKGEHFNIDVYVPPVIPYAYDYLFLWQGSTKYGYLAENEKGHLLYTIYEYDFYLPRRHEDWLDRQAGIGKIIREEKFGSVYVQRRERL